jgi:hypothetical protein
MDSDFLTVVNMLRSQNNNYKTADMGLAVDKRKFI